MEQFTNFREIFVNYGKRMDSSLTPITRARDAAALIRNLLPDNSREHFVSIYLDGAHKPIAYAVVSTGIANCCPVHAREVFQRAVLSGAVAVLVAHNHPSGEVSPSNEDRSVTRKLIAAGELIGIALLDHVILGEEDTFYSFVENGEL
jgi:DNA repair protein RadC